MPLRPSILDEYTEVEKERPLSGKWAAETDELYLEDESGRVMVTGPAIEASRLLVSGVVCALLGHEVRGGEFVVEAICFPSFPPQAPAPAPAAAQGSAPTRRRLAFVSGLMFGDAPGNADRNQLLVDYLCGSAGGVEGAAEIGRVIIAGNTVALKDGGATSANLEKDVTMATGEWVATPLEQADSFLEQLCATCPVDILAGPLDPANNTLPQRPMFRFLFRTAGQFTSLTPVSNPCDLDVAGGLRVVGTSGQNVADFVKYHSHFSYCDALEQMLLWSHIAPTAPDSLHCFPFQDRDPFILTECPHILFAGNAPGFEARVVAGPQGQKVTLLAIPSFAQQHAIVLVDVDTLQVETLEFAM